MVLQLCHAFILSKMEEEYEPSKHIRFGLYSKREDNEGQLKISIVTVTVEVKTNDTQEHVLKAVHQAQDMMLEEVIRNFSALYVPLSEL